MMPPLLVLAHHLGSARLIALLLDGKEYESFPIFNWENDGTKKKKKNIWSKIERNFETIDEFETHANFQTLRIFTNFKDWKNDKYKFSRMDDTILYYFKGGTNCEGNAMLWAGCTWTTTATTTTTTSLKIKTSVKLKNFHSSTI